MDPNSVKSTLSNLAFGNVMAAAARDYKKELLAQEKTQASSSNNEEGDLNELMDDPELEKLRADKIAALKKEAEKREALERLGHGEYREVSEGDFLGEVTGVRRTHLSLLPNLQSKRCLVSYFSGKGDDKNSEKTFLSLFSNHHAYHIPEELHLTEWLASKILEETMISPPRH